MQVVTVTLLAAFFMQVGFLLWKVAANTLPPIESTRPLKLVVAFFTNTKWVIGWIATLVGWVLFIKAADVGAISLVQPLMSTGDLFLVIMSVVLLGERLSRREWSGIALVILGALFLSFQVTPITYSSLHWPHVALFYAIAGIVAFAFFLVARRYPANAEVLLAVVSGLICGIGSSLTKLMTSYLALSGELTSVFDFVFNPIFPAMVAANVLGLLVLQMAFQKGRASVIVPIDLSVINILVFLAGIALFNETVTLYHLISLVIITSGIFYLQPKGSGKR